jgi:hypothetical protein
MTGAILLTILFLTFWVIYSKRTNKTSIKLTAIFALSVIWVGYFFVWLDKTKVRFPDDNRYYLLLIPCLLATAYAICRFAKAKSLTITAKQQSYWDIKPDEIYNFYNHRVEIKKDRVETRVNGLKKAIYRQYDMSNKFFTTNLFNEINGLKLTEIKNIDELKTSRLYTLIFNKIKEFLTFREEEANFDAILTENGNIAEYFIIDIWERYTKPFNIGTANLDIYANRDIERDLIGALDNATLSSVKRNGAALFFKYAEFKRLIPVVEDEEAMHNNTNTETYDFD